jgi:hypothetical protein
MSWPRPWHDSLRVATHGVDALMRATFTSQINHGCFHWPSRSPQPPPPPQQQQQQLTFFSSNHTGLQVLVEYNVNYAPNVVSCKRGETTPEQIVILGAHLDNIPSTGRAPGANDDGSGSASLLAAAQAVGESGFKFKKTLCFEHYTGEEQGLVGSRAQAKFRKERGDDVVAQIQQDMIAVRLPQDTQPGVGAHNTSHLHFAPAFALARL